jgi:hypothetical protein
MSDDGVKLEQLVPEAHEPKAMLEAYLEWIQKDLEFAEKEPLVSERLYRLAIVWRCLESLDELFGDVIPEAKIKKRKSGKRG